MSKCSPVYELSPETYYDSIGTGSVGMVYHRSIGISLIATFDNPQKELSSYRILDNDEANIVRDEILNLG